VVPHGVKQAIYHRGRDAQASGQQWGEADLAKMKALSDIGLQLSSPAASPLPTCRCLSRSTSKPLLPGARWQVPNPPQVAQAFHSQIRDIWGE
jgi:3-dehydro-L-gulonate-6-phosphate decarboxylase